MFKPTASTLPMETHHKHPQYSLRPGALVKQDGQPIDLCRFYNGIQVAGLFTWYLPFLLGLWSTCTAERGGKKTAISTSFSLLFSGHRLTPAVVFQSLRLRVNSRTRGCFGTYTDKGSTILPRCTDARSLIYPTDFHILQPLQRSDKAADYWTDLFGRSLFVTWP